MHDLSRLLLRFRPDADVNSQSGFDAALAGQAGEAAQQRLEERGEDASEDRDVASALELESPEQPRNDKGQFVGKTDPETPEQPEAVAPEAEAPEAPEAPETPEDDEVARLRKELSAAQEMIGRQSAEVRESRSIREELAELRGRLDERSSQPVAPPPLIDRNTTEALESMVEEDGGPATIKYLIDNGHDHLVDQAINLWGEEEPVQAARFAVRYEQILAGAEQPEPQAGQQLPPELQGYVRERQIADSAAAVRQELGEETWALVKDHLSPTISEAPKQLQDMVMSPDPHTRIAGIRIAADLAKGRVISQATEKAQQQANQERGASKQAAQVASGSLRPVGNEGQTEKPANEMTSAERQEAFRKALLAEETTSVQDGLRGI